MIESRRSLFFQAVGAASLTMGVLIAGRSMGEPSPSSPIPTAPTPTDSPNQLAMEPTVSPAENKRKRSSHLMELGTSCSTDNKPTIIVSPQPGIAPKKGSVRVVGFENPRDGSFVPASFILPTQEEVPIFQGELPDVDLANKKAPELAIQAYSGSIHDIFAPDIEMQLENEKEYIGRLVELPGRPSSAAEIAAKGVEIDSVLVTTSNCDPKAAPIAAKST